MIKQHLLYLEKYKWEKPNLEEIPIGKELVENYLIPLSKIPEIQEVIALNTKVISIARKNIDKMKTAHRENVPFVIYTGHEGTIQAIEAKVVDVTGTWGNQKKTSRKTSFMVHLISWGKV